ncbi:uncharacterized protein si:ch211-13c6.2 isoform X2 [Centropristis striata]|nr:uncharacterized protein si:ch211-13c6.2 isoform X2 [Centropristis striata]XP_059205716.1 uncharacterized protein si:ch211-13c6.2 isoform X2 [Centropristis striata]
MKLEEPIIGLNFLDQYTSNDPQQGVRYACRLCSQHANLPEMVRHVIGRKHRQKYMEFKRPDLVTWNKQTIINHGGKIIRARAEIIERQDGRGTPTVMQKKGTEGKLNISRVPPKQKQNRVRNFPQKEQDLPSLLPELRDYQGESSHPGRYPPSFPNAFPPQDPYMRSGDRPMFQQEDTHSHNRMEQERLRPDEMYRREYMGDDYCPEYEDVENPQRRAVLESRGAPRYDSREEMPHGQAQLSKYYPDEAPPQRRPYAERDQLKEFYTEEVRRGRVGSAEYSPSQLLYPAGDEQRWSLDRESDIHDSMNRTSRQGSSEPEGNRRRFPTPMESERPRGSLFSMSRDYCHGMSDPHQEEAGGNPGPSRTGPPAAQRRVEATRSMSDIPEPFRRFLTGAAKDEGHGKRKRKSRFSDATAEEVKTTKEMFSDEYGPPNLKFAGRSRPVGGPLRLENHRPQHPDHYTATNYQRGGSDSGVFDMLKNIEIENAEEADFLKNKLCDLLKEFKTKKSGKAVPNSHGRAAISEDYSSPDPELSPRNQYESTLREDSDLRRPEERYFDEDHRGRDQTPDDRLQDYHRPVRGELRQSNRSLYEEVFGRSGMSQLRHASHPDEPVRDPERFQEPRHPRDYRPGPEEFLDSRSSAPPRHMDLGPRMDRGPRYSNNLDKITSTLLELVARK